MTKKYSFEEIENYIIDRELGFCDKDENIENIIAIDTKYQNINKVQMMISEAMEEKEFLFSMPKIDFDINEVKNKKQNIWSIIKNIFYPSGEKGSGILGKYALAMIILLVMMVPIKMHLQRQIDYIERQSKVEDKKVMVKVEDYFEKTKVIDKKNIKKSEVENFVAVEKKQSQEQIQEEKPLIVSNEKINIQKAKTDNKIDEKEIKTMNVAKKSQKINNTEENYSLNEKKVEKISEKTELLAKNETTGEVKESLSKNEEEHIKNKTNQSYREESSERSYVNLESKRTPIRSKKITTPNSVTALSMQKSHLDVEEDQDYKIIKDEGKSKYINVIGIEKNKIYTKINPKFEKSEGYNYKFYIDDKEYIEGSLYNKNGRHTFKVKIFKGNDLVDEVKIKFEIRN